MVACSWKMREYEWGKATDLFLVSYHTTKSKKYVEKELKMRPGLLFDAFNSLEFSFIFKPTIENIFSAKPHNMKYCVKLIDWLIAVAR